MTITGEGGEVCSEEALKPHNVTKTYVPQLTPSKSDSKGDQDEYRSDKQHPPKVCAGDMISYTSSCMIVRSITLKHYDRASMIIRILL